MQFKKTTVAAVAAACIGAPAVPVMAGELEIFQVSNFRDNRGGDEDRPLNWVEGDFFGIGINVIDSDTGVAPADAIVKARNTNTGEEIILNRSPGTAGEFFRRIPYSAGNAAGDWVVEVVSNVGTKSALLEAYGTGQESGAHPLVENVTSSGSGASRTLNWTVPAEVADQTAVGGNVDRIRMRLFDSNGDRLLDEKNIGPGGIPSVTADEFTFGSDLIDHNGLYVAQVMVEGFDPFGRSRYTEGFVVDDAVTVGGEAVSPTAVFAYRDVRGENSVGWTVGERTSIGVNVDVFDGTFIHAEQGDSLLTMRQADEANRPFEFFSGFEFDSSLSGPWEIVMNNGAQRSTVMTEAFNVPASPIGFADNIAIIANDLTPTLTWDLPDGDFDTLELGLFDDSTDERLSVFGAGQDQLFAQLDPTATSFMFDAGQLEYGRQYVARLVMRKTEDKVNPLHDDTVDRSVTFFNFAPIEGNSGGEEIFLPTLDEDGTFQFDFDVEAAEPIMLDPFVAIGYDYEIGIGDPLFTSVALPEVGDNIFDLWVFDDMGIAVDSGFDINSGDVFDFASELGDDFFGVDYTNGAERFRILGIEVGAGLDPMDTTAFVTTLTFGSSGRFTGTMTPITVFVPDAAVPEPETYLLLLAGAGLVPLMARRRRRRD